MKRAGICTLLVLCAFHAFGATRPDECFSLIEIFRAGGEELERRIVLYDTRLKVDPADSGADLALAMLYVALGSSNEESRSANIARADKALSHASVFLKSEPDSDLGLLFSGGPHEWYVRFMRANTYANTPRSMNKWSVAENDYLYLSAFVDRHPEREPYLVAANYYRALMKKAGGDRKEARSCLRRALELEELHGTGAHEAALAARLLKDLEENQK